jgi:hypothetical protein
VAEEIGMSYWITGALMGISQAELVLGNPQAASIAAERALERALADGIQDRARWARVRAIEAYEALGNHERVEELRRQADELGHALPAD